MWNLILNFPPDKGLEPLTLGLKVPRSTDWANRAWRSGNIVLFYYTWLKTANTWRQLHWPSFSCDLKL